MVLVMHRVLKERAFLSPLYPPCGQGGSEVVIGRLSWKGLTNLRDM